MHADPFVIAISRARCFRRLTSRGGQISDASPPPTESGRISTSPIGRFLVDDCSSPRPRGMICRSLVRGRALPVTQIPPVLIADSITRVGADAAGAVVINGSHGGIYAAYSAAKLRVAAAVFNDAGVGRDKAGIAGLDYLAGLAIPAAAVGHHTARIGDGPDMIARGIITHANSPAIALGCHPSMACRDAMVALQ